MADPAVELYVATLSEVQRQSAQLGSSSTTASSGGGSSGSASGSSGWVVLESQSIPAQLPGEAGCSLWPQQQWQIAYEILFCQCPPSIARLRPHQADDMLFFVYTDEAAAAARTRLTVRRRESKQPALPPDLQGPVTEEPGAAWCKGSGSSTARSSSSSSKAAQVDWRASVQLMVVLQSAYRLSVVTAADAELLGAFVDGAPSTTTSIAGVHHVTKVVHATPSHVPVNLDDSRSDAGCPQISYPDICFAVDSCDDAFQTELLRQPTDCYCVLLHADVASSWRLPVVQAAGGSGAAAPSASDASTVQLAGLALSDKQQAGGSQPPRNRSKRGSPSSSSSRSNSRGSSWQWNPAGSEEGSDLTVMFSGYVSHQQLTAALGNQLVGDLVRQVLRAAAAATWGDQHWQPLATCRVIMKGPAGKGVADVAVSSFPPGNGVTPSGADKQQQHQQQVTAGGGRPNLFERAQMLAKGVAAVAEQAAGPRGGASRSGVDVVQLHLRCALMMLQVPVEMLADNILQALQT